METGIANGLCFFFFCARVHTFSERVVAIARVVGLIRENDATRRLCRYGGGGGEVTANQGVFRINTMGRVADLETIPGDRRRVSLPFLLATI